MDVFVVQSTVSTVRHISTEYKTLDIAKFCASMKVPVIVGNGDLQCDSRADANGVAAVLIGVGPGAACTSAGGSAWVFPR